MRNFNETYREGDECPQCGIAEEIEPLTGDRGYDTICGVCGWRMNKEKQNDKAHIPEL